MWTLLEILWTKVAQHIIDKIMTWGTIDEKGKSRDYAVPVSFVTTLQDVAAHSDCCCLGEFSFMPIHAAGIYNVPSPIRASNFLVSSYDHHRVLS